MSTGYIIRDTETGKQFIAGSGKRLWATTGAAKNAWRQSGDELRRAGVPNTRADRWYDPGSFNDQARYVCEELTSQPATRSVFIIKSDYEVGIEHTAFKSREVAEEVFLSLWRQAEPECEWEPYFEVREYFLEA